MEATLFYRKRKLDIEVEIGSKKGLFQSSNPESATAQKEAERIGKHLGKDIKRWDVEEIKKEAVDNVIGILVNEYYGKEEEFSKNEKMVTELQTNLAVLKYDLGEKGVDGDFGTKSKIALGNFEVDYSKEIREVAENRLAVENLKNGRDR